MMSKILLLILPALVYGRINIRIKAASSESKADVEFLGSNIDLISDKERETFRITDGPLKDACRAFSGGRPDDAYVKSPTPWNDLYSRYGWSQTQRTLYPRSAKILGIKSEPVIVATKDFINNSTIKAKYSAQITQEVQDTVSNSWSKGGELTIGQEISYSVEVGVAEIGGTTSISYTSSWGEETSKSQAVTVGSSTGVEVELEPGQSVVASLTATRGTMEVQVDYTATLDGDVAANYGSTYKGHHFWRYDINAVMSAAGIPRSVDSREVLKIGFYSDAQVIVTDKVNNNKLFAAPAAVFK